MVVGGDLLLGRSLNAALYDDDARARALAGVAPLLKKADLAVVNGEGVVALGGEITDKGEQRPFAFRAHPLAVRMMADAGIDLVNVGNDHSIDYGPDALQEMLDRLVLAGMDYTGGGDTRRDAVTPAYRVIGDTVVAVVGADLSTALAYPVRPKRPTLLRYPGLLPESVDEIVRNMTNILRVARKHAHVVVFTPHWGENDMTAPTDHTRHLAARLVQAGYDAIVGHSAHVVQGAELLDGVAVAYDAGNLLLDRGAAAPMHRALLFELEFDRAGVHL